jgi:isopentenyl-diphosphate delta-isomerase
VDDAHRVVSSEAEQLILVDRDDNEMGHLSKGECHDGAGVLHRAFSLFLFNADGELLLQQRARTKRLWGGFWSNSCCSHPRRGETMRMATRRRLVDELNVSADLKYVYKFCYQAEFGDAGAEHELCHVYLGRLHDTVHANKQEIAGVRFIAVDTLESEFETSPETFTPWLKMEWRTLSNKHADVLACYVTGREP